ncbi:TolC family protein [Catalinimonas niigatensis]|uniref:TolC family protein n=1 Tax=Catalinimonas niigatensis TaxID=1397264 RepID=UPI0026663D9B|nr:TolC family protein [Catalinimonas niigatensis]WPP48312.1 TolC family protein [Catalinimonas niigatensis]
MKIQNKLLIALGIFLVSAIRSYAQEPLSLSDAIQLGLANNFDIQIEALNVEIAKNNNTWGAAGRWPTISFSMSQNNNFRDVQNAANPFQPTGLSISNSLGPGVSVSWILFDGFRVQINRERLQKLQELSMGNAQLVVENTVQAIITQYYFVKLEQERLDVLEKVFTLSKDRYAYIKLKGELGSAVTFDVLQEQNAFLTDSSNFVTQEVNYLNARRTLNLFMGQPINTAYTLTDSLEIDPTEYDLEVMYDKMVTSNTNLMNQYLNLELARTETRLAKTELYPRLSLNANGSYDLSRQDLSQAQFPDFGDAGGNTRELVTNQTTSNYALGFTINYLLFDGGRVKRNIQNAYTTERISQLQIDQLKLSLRNDLISTFDLYNVRQKLLSISQENIRSSELNLELAEERYKNGTINSFDYRQIQINYLNTALDNAQAKYNMLDSETELLRLTGGILNEYENLN